MKRFMSAFVLGTLVLTGVSGFSARADDAVSPPVDGFKVDAEAGIVISSGNADTQSYNFKEGTSYRFSENLFKLTGHYLDAEAKGVTSARNWDLGLRYERALFDGVSAYLGQNVESDIFAGYEQRYNTDVGGKYAIMKTDDFYWNGEAGYRFSSQNSTDGTQKSSSFLRFYTEAGRNWGKEVSAKYWIEFLPDLTNSSGYRLNTELSLSSILTSVFSIKTAYGLRYDNAPISSVSFKTDTTFTTSLVAKI